jgi:hypothetical protein
VTAPGVRCVCSHTRYMHAPEDNNRCHVSDHLLLVCTCDGFSEADPETYEDER